MAQNGSKYAMPMIVLNLGGEMLYILNQRLQAQNIADEKAKKVLQDVVKAMFSPQFIQELFKPQEVYTLVSTKQIFEKLAHSSIMRLNQSSMDKLFDLMTMGFKYQILQCNNPQQYLHLLLVHLESVQKLLGQGSVSDLAQTAIDLAIETYSKFTISNWVELKVSLYKFIQGKRIKVSLFLQHKMQNLDGTLVLNCKGKLPKGIDIPGTIRFYEASKQISLQHFVHECEGTTQIGSSVMDPESAIGTNMYAKGYQPGMKMDEPSPSTLRAMRITTDLKSMPLVDQNSDRKSMKSGIDDHRSTAKSTAKLELNMLADILGVNQSSSEKSSQIPWRVNLFPEFIPDAKNTGSGSSTSYDESDSAFIIIDIDGTADSKSIDKYLESLDMVDHVKATADSKYDDDDLLSLMDSAK